MSTCPACLNVTGALNFGYRRNSQPTYKKCGACKTLYLDPMPTENHLKNYYNSLSESGSYEKNSSFFRESSIDSFVSKCKRTIGQGNWLDFGCFDGYLIKLVQNNGFKGFGVELQETPRVTAQEIAHGEVVASLPSNRIGVTMEVISMKDSIEHLTNPNKIFSDFSMMVENNAEIYIQTPNATSFVARISSNRWVCLNSPEHTVLFSHKGLMLFLKRHGWTIVRTRPVFKSLQIGYVIKQLHNFGNFQKVAKFLDRVTPALLKNNKFIFMGGEFFVQAIRSNIQD
jgi:2-polyprenyl-3-methyl-5-hydroxy-6-metoxy-1,4-benzoquinol methylase